MNDLFKIIGIIALVLVALGLILKVGLPLFGLVSTLLWGISGLLALVLKVVFFVALIAAFIVGLLMLFSWIIREVSD